MDSFYLILIAVLLCGVLVLLAFLKPEWAKKYAGYVVLGVAALGGLVALFTQRKTPAPPDPEIKEKEDKLKQDLAEVHEEAEEQIREAEQKHEEVKVEVAEIQQIDDKEERLRRLSDLFNRTRRR